jgi:hypothetical protein
LYLLRSYNGGLLTTSKASTEQGRRIGHQVLIGFWLGLTSQMSSMATHEERRSPVGTLLKIPVQWLPGAIFVAVWQYLFLGKLLSVLRTFLVSIQSVLRALVEQNRSCLCQSNLWLVKNDAFVKLFDVALASPCLSSVAGHGDGVDERDGEYMTGMYVYSRVHFPLSGCLASCEALKSLQSPSPSNFLASC